MGPGADGLADRFGATHAVVLSALGQRVEQLCVHSDRNDGTLASLAEPWTSATTQALYIEAFPNLFLPSLNLVVSDAVAVDRLVHDKYCNTAWVIVETTALACQTNRPA